MAELQIGLVLGLLLLGIAMMLGSSRKGRRVRVVQLVFGVLFFGVGVAFAYQAGSGVVWGVVW